MARTGVEVVVLSPGEPVRTFKLGQDIRNQGAYELAIPFGVSAGDILCK